MEDELESEEDYNTQKTIIERVIYLLIHKDKVLLDLSTDNNSILVVNPNYVMEEM